MFNDTSFYVELYIGPTSDPAPRNQLIDAIEADPELGVRTRRKQGIRDNLWRVLFSRQCAKWGAEGPDIPSCTAAVARTLNEFAPYLARLTEVLDRLREQR